MKPSTPRPIAWLLNWHPTWMLAKLALVSAYLLGAITKLSHWPGAIAEQASLGIPFPALFAGITIAVELTGSILVLTRRFVWLGAGMLGIFTLAAAVIANAFWVMQGAARFQATNAFFEHIGLVGGLVLAAVLAQLTEHQM